MADESFNEFVREQLAGLAGISFRRMFGGQGIYRHEVFFGILYQGRLYFKTDAHTRPDYLAADSKPFQPNAQQRLPAYYEVPPHVLESPAELCTWAERASTLAVARTPRGRSPRPARRSPQAASR
ncbi:MAG: hypothetical protein RL514_784 [Verrucomicrobiota bacterium]|jgi:DNA transformation protein